jgi:nucleoid-associated protein EbfC
MMDSAGFTDPEVAEMVEHLTRQQEEIAQVQRSVEAMMVKGSSRGREVVATLRGTGQLAEVSFDPGVLRRFDAHDIGSLVVEAVNDAQRRLAKASEERFAPLLAVADRLA